MYIAIIVAIACLLIVLALMSINENDRKNGYKNDRE